ncbi:DUF3667 domain-containing protein [Flavobacterium sp. SM2513]|uniref:DUF3667 domain-containing protein n=1 Tax=Flavobacterium sp. SM2513 TaxID=3424766 RepID=UPI003D7F5DEB
MGKTHIRNDKTCLNCYHVVEKRFCGNCGQENIDTRKTFHHLFIHFFEDLTHYENAFWKTIKNLLFKPAALSREYLSGKRMSYLAPVRLYIFISFVTFFLIAVIPSSTGTLELDLNDKVETTETVGTSVSSEEKKLDELLNRSGLTQSEKDTLRNNFVKKEFSTKNSSAFGYKSVKEFDSLQKYGSEDDKVPVIFHKYIKNSIANSEKYSALEIKDKLFESIFHNFPKVLLIYMPLFAFFLWAFHSKKKWYYFDHGIFTLHYFSFLLLISLVLILTGRVLELFDSYKIFTYIETVLDFIGIIWMIYYFFPAHHRFYGETRTVSFLKSLVLFFLNVIFMTLLSILFFIYSFITIH